jgi:hypothetical protein
VIICHYSKAWNDENHICKIYDKMDNKKSSLNLSMKARKWYQEWVSKVKSTADAA